jgi:hypothetical protein
MVRLLKKNYKKFDKILFAFENLQIPIKFIFEKQCTPSPQHPRSSKLCQRSGDQHKLRSESSLAWMKLGFLIRIGQNINKGPSLILM